METFMPENDAASKVIQFSNKNGNLFRKFSFDFLIRTIDVHQLSGFSFFIANQNREIPIQLFVAFLGSNIKHEEHETLYLMIGLCDFYQEIRANAYLNQNDNIRMSHLTDYLCQAIQDDSQTALTVKQDIQYDIQEYPQIVTSPPCIKYQIAPTIPIMTKQSNKKDKILKKPFHQIIVAEKLGRILVLNRLSSSIEIYSQELDLLIDIKPKVSKQLRKDFPIMSIGYSSNYQRIGCIVKCIGLVFWENQDNFESQKIIEGVNAHSIMYLQSSEVWMTYQKAEMKLWDLQKQICFAFEKIQDAQYISSVMQIKNLNVVIVSVNFKDSTKKIICYRILKGTFITLCQTKLLGCGCHSLQYNRSTNSIILLGYKNSVSVWQLDLANKEFNYVSELHGHKYIVMAATTIGQTSVIATGDDLGFLRLWDLKNLRCIQAMRLSQQIAYLGFFRDELIFCDKRINITGIDMPKFFIHSPHYLTHVYEQNSDSLLLITGYECLIIDMLTGKTKQTIILCKQEQQVYAIKKLRNSIVLGTNKGNLNFYDRKFHQKTSHHILQSEILHIVGDSTGRSLIIADNQGKITVWLQKSEYYEKPIKSIIGLDSESMITHLDLFEPDCLIGASLQNTLYLIDFESMKIEKTIIFDFTISKMKFHDKFPLLFVLDDHGRLYCIRFKKKNECRFSILQKYRFNLLFDIDGYVKEFYINQKDEILLGFTNGIIAKANLRNFIDQFGFNLSIQSFVNKSPHIYRPAHQIAKNCPIQPENKPYHQISIGTKDFQTYEIAAVGHKKLCDEVIFQIKPIKSGDYCSVMNSNGHFFILMTESLNVMGQRMGNEVLPFHWSIIPDDYTYINKKIINTLEVFQDILNYSFTSQQLKYFYQPNIQIRPFISDLIGDIYQLNILPQKQNPIKTLAKPKSMAQQRRSKSLKEMQITKKFRKQKQTNKNLAAKRKWGKNSEDNLYIEYLKPDFRQKLSFTKEDEPCQLYERIQSKWNNLKMRASTVNRSLSEAKQRSRRKNQQEYHREMYQVKTLKSIKFKQIPSEKENRKITVFPKEKNQKSGNRYLNNIHKKGLTSILRERFNQKKWRQFRKELS